MKRSILFLIPVVVAVLALSVTGITTMIVQSASAQGSGCPDPGQCTCNAASGVMTDHAMAAPFNRINNGCTGPA